jgi:hypothetical protein
MKDDKKKKQDKRNPLSPDALKEKAKHYQPPLHNQKIEISDTKSEPSVDSIQQRNR